MIIWFGCGFIGGETGVSGKTQDNTKTLKK
jgi:hypothetical protein